MTALLAQSETELDLQWVAEDPINLSFTVQNVDWSGTYRVQVRKVADPNSPLLCELTVVATFITPNTNFHFTRDADESEKPGECRWDMQKVGGITYLRGTAHILKNVTRLS